MKSIYNNEITKKNAELDKFIDSINSDLSVAKKRDDISTILDKCVEFPLPIKFDLTIHYVFLSVLLLILFVFLGVDKNWNNSINIFIAILLFVGIGVVVFLIVSAFNKISTLNEFFRQKTMKILYKGTEIPSKYLEEQRRSFQDFYRGNYENTITSGLEVDFHSPMGLIRPEVVSYHYIDEHKEKVRNSNGNWETKYIYKHYDRQGIIFPIGKPKSLLISKYRHAKIYKETFVPSSNTFKKIFHVQGESEFCIAKFLEPSVVLRIEQAAKELEDLTIEFSDDGSMLVCQENTGLLELKTTFNLSNPKAFKDELFTSSYSKLDEIFSLATDLIKYIK